MNLLSDPVAKALKTCKANGVLPLDAGLSFHDGRPWPVTLLTAFGAWFAAVPLIVVVYMLLGDMFSESVGPYFTGMLFLAGAVVVLRSRALPVFVEQLAVIALLVGFGALGYGLFRDATMSVAAACMVVLALGLAFAIPQVWLRELLGAAAAFFALLASLPERNFESDEQPVFRIWLALHAALLLWLAVLALQHRHILQRLGVQRTAALESISAGWLLLLLCGLCLWSGMTFMVGGSVGGGLWNQLAHLQSAMKFNDSARLLSQVGSVAMACAAAFVTERAWPSLRQAPVAAVGLAMGVLCWFLPALGAAFLALAWTSTSQRWRLAAAAGFAAAWMVGSFYYQLNWTLANKAALLVLLGAVIGAAAWWAARPGTQAPQLALREEKGKRAAFSIALAVALTLAMANFSIWQKETLIATGLKVLVELAPADPRSLMQGDFMRLNYRILDRATAQAIGQGLTGQRPYLVVRLDAQGIAQFVRADRNEYPLASGEMRIELTPKDGEWTLVSDAWFFREGDAQRWEAARYGEFRVTPDGRALLVGLADAQRQAIAVSP